MITPTPKISYGNTGLEVEDEAPHMFPKFSSLRFDYWEQREYVTSELRRMALDGTLCVTDVLRQRKAIRDYVGAMLKGVMQDPDTKSQRPSGEPLDPDIASYMVRVKAINGNSTVSYVRSKKPRPKQIYSTTGKTSLSSDPSGGGGWTTRTRPLVAENVDYGVPEVDLPLAEAWTALAQCGEKCRHLPSHRMKNKYWRIKEVFPRPVEEERRGPGRPAKGA